MMRFHPFHLVSPAVLAIALLVSTEGCVSSKGSVAKTPSLAEELTGPVSTVAESDRGLIVSLQNILFDFDQAVLRPEVEEALSKIADVLARYPDIKFYVEGHTDNLGSDDYNLDLSRRRAQAVANFLGEHGVASERMEIAGYGETQPKADNETEEGRQLNRRVDLVIPGVS